MRIYLSVPFACFFLLAQPSRAQLIDREGFDFVDAGVQEMGAMNDSSLDAIVTRATAPCLDEICQLRGLYMWTIANIARDCTPPERLAQTNGTASYTFRERRGTSAGFASLLADMCRMRGIHCEMVQGLVKTRAAQIGNLDDDADLGYWNVVRADGRWFVLDACLGAGDCDGRQFIRESSDAWFLTNRRMFSMSHLPLAAAKQLMDSPRSKPDFVSGPAMGAVAAILGVLPLPGQRGTLRGHADSALTLRFLMWPASMMERVGKVEALIDGKLLAAGFESADDTLIVHLPLPREGTYELGMYVNGKPAWAFKAQVAPAMPRPAGKK